MVDDEMRKKIWARLRYGVTNFDEDIVVKAAQSVIDNNLDAYEAIIFGLIPGIEEVGELYERQEYFVPEMLMCAEALYAGMDILRPHLKSVDTKSRGQIIIGVVQGDIHNIGKNIVKMMFESAGFEVHDLGHDVPLDKFISQQLKTDSDIVALSAMMTTTMVGMKDVVVAIKEKNPMVKIMIGGAPVDEDFMHKAGADGYAKDANNALKEAVKMIAFLRKKIKNNE